YCFVRYLVFDLRFFFTVPATPEIYPLSLHDALPIFAARERVVQSKPYRRNARAVPQSRVRHALVSKVAEQRVRLFHRNRRALLRSEEHTSELQSHLNLVCRLLLEKKKKTTKNIARHK